MFSWLITKSDIVKTLKLTIFSIVTQNPDAMEPPINFQRLNLFYQKYEAHLIVGGFLKIIYAFT